MSKNMFNYKLVIKYEDKGAARKFVLSVKCTNQ